MIINKNKRFFLVIYYLNYKVAQKYLSNLFNYILLTVSFKDIFELW